MKDPTYVFQCYRRSGYICDREQRIFEVTKLLYFVYIVPTVPIVHITVIMMTMTVVLVTMLSLLLWLWDDFLVTTVAAAAAMGAPANGGSNESAQQEVMHIVYALDPIMMPLAIVSVKSVIEVTRNQSLLSFHFVTVGLTWHDDFLADMKRSLCVECSFESVKWNPPAIIKTMLV